MPSCSSEFNISKYQFMDIRSIFSLQLVQEYSEKRIIFH
ncbi:hypothetical protein SLEP1_g32405 [Rubroshorea leprosula]|uniref:Uncharacterized protein n=1 Tax=Rubroshorea leprosula TaxID=152421 RepID=A0AAV5KD96_9ROSI|nr:hypothetical protein SLEP1_g32405 [Rubroshorea leprosula]